MNCENRHAVFVYGTLMRGQRAHHMLQDSEYAGVYSLQDYAMYHLGRYPGIVPTERQRNLIREPLRQATEQNSTRLIYIGGGGSALESAPRVSFVYFFTKKYTRKMANGLSQATTTELSVPASIRVILRMRSE